MPSDRKYICFDKNMEERVFNLRSTADRHAVGSRVEEYVHSDLVPVIVREPFVVGNYYDTVGGDHIKIVEQRFNGKVGIIYGKDGVWRSNDPSSPDFGKILESASSLNTDKYDLIPLYRKA